jgi:trypsin
MKVGSTTSGAQWRNIVAGTMRPHPSYANTDKYDLMIFKIQTSTKVPSVINRDAGNPIAGQSLRVIGFGLTTEGGSASSSLRKVTVPAVSHSTCNQQYSGEIDETSEFCAGVSGKDSCQGDSGGPIFDASGKQVGVVSWGYGCAQANYPGVYSRVSGALSWIDQQICALSSVPPASCFAAAPVAAPTTPVAAPIAPVVAPTAPVAAPIAPVAAPTAPVAAPITPVAAPTSVTAPTVTYVTVTASVQYDAYPEEFGWKIIDGTTGKTIVNYPAKTFTADYKFLSGTVSLIKGRTYRLVMTDTIGDGICCAYGNGYVEIYAGNFYYVSIWGNIGKSYSMSFIA